MAMLSSPQANLPVTTKAYKNLLPKKPAGEAHGKQRLPWPDTERRECPNAASRRPGRSRNRCGEPLAHCAPSAEDSVDFVGRGIVVKAFLAACLAAIVLAAIAAIILDSLQEPADRAFTTPYTRVGD